MPLIVGEGGAKYGKTEGNAVWLNKEKTAPFDFYQFFIRTKDTEVETSLRLFTFKGDNEIEAILKRHRVTANNPFLGFF